MDNTQNNNQPAQPQNAPVPQPAADIEWDKIIGKLLAKWKLLFISAVLTVLIVYPLARTVPKYYSVEVKLAPELGSSSSGGSSLKSLLSTFGVSSGSSSNALGDAILPTLYPDLMNSKVFLVSLFDVPVQSKKGDIKTTYYDYLSNYQKASLWGKAFKAIGKTLAELLPSDDDNESTASGSVNAAALTKSQNEVAKAISEKVSCNVDTKSGVITIDVQDQDPVICAAIADSTCMRLQEFITEYRTKKSRAEMQDAEKQFIQSKADYEAAKAKVEAFNNSNWDLVDEDLITEKQALSNEMQLQYSMMSAFSQQLISARAKYQTETPVYTVLDGASVPLKPTGPSRLQALLVALFLVLGIEGALIVYGDELKKQWKNIKAQTASK